MTGGAARERTADMAVTIVTLLLVWLTVRVLLIAPMEATYGADAEDYAARGWHVLVFTGFVTLARVRHVHFPPGWDPVRRRWSNLLFATSIVLGLLAAVMYARMAITEMTR